MICRMGDGVARGSLWASMELELIRFVGVNIPNVKTESSPSDEAESRLDAVNWRVPPAYLVLISSVSQGSLQRREGGAVFVLDTLSYIVIPLPSRRRLPFYLFQNIVSDFVRYHMYND
jgi:hypothetical protein